MAHAPTKLDEIAARVWSRGDRQPTPSTNVSKDLAESRDKREAHLADITLARHMPDSHDVP